MTVKQNSSMFFFFFELLGRTTNVFFFLTSARFSKEDTLMLFLVVFVFIFALMYSFLCRRGKRDDAGQCLSPLFCVSNADNIIYNYGVVLSVFFYDCYDFVSFSFCLLPFFPFEVFSFLDCTPFFVFTLRDVVLFLL